MKRLVMSIMIFLLSVTVVSCRTLRRDYNDQELSQMAISDFGFQSFSTFKIVDVETAFELTGQRYQNCGIVIGTRYDRYAMLFVPRNISDTPFLIAEDFFFDLEDIYDELKILEDDLGNLLYNDPSGDYGGLSLSVEPYDQISNAYQELSFDSKLFFIITTDGMIFNVGYVEGTIMIFDESLNLLNEVQ